MVIKQICLQELQLNQAIKVPKAVTAYPIAKVVTQVFWCDTRADLASQAKGVLVLLGLMNCKLETQGHIQFSCCRLACTDVPSCLVVPADGPEVVAAHSMAAQHQPELQEIRRRLREMGAPLSPDGLAGADTELMRFAFTAGLTHARTEGGRWAADDGPGIFFVFLSGAVRLNQPGI